MNFAANDLAARRPVWHALSDPYLDTDVSLSLKWRVDILAASPYPVDELQAILFDEVNPVCRLNKWVVAGAWAGFDLDWLEERIVARRGRPSRWLLATAWATRLRVPCREDWLITRDGVIAARAAPR